MEELVNAIDGLIIRYSSTEYKYSSTTHCPLCKLFFEYIESEPRCISCPNSIFIKSGWNTGCVERGHTYSKLAYNKLENYPNLVEFWTTVKELILLGESVDEATLKAVIPFQE